jgi:hypothetical protein
MTRGVSQLYLSLSDPMPNSNLAVRLYFKPHVLLIWLGAAIMFTGGALSISSRREQRRHRRCNRRSEVSEDEIRQNECTNPRQFGAIRTEPGNLRLRRTAWWGRELCHGTANSMT